MTFQSDAELQKFLENAKPEQKQKFAEAIGFENASELANVSVNKVNEAISVRKLAYEQAGAVDYVNALRQAQPNLNTF